jgi:hypothetical protein
MSSDQQIPEFVVGRPGPDRNAAGILPILGARVRSELLFAGLKARRLHSAYIVRKDSGNE